MANKNLIRLFILHSACKIEHMKIIVVGATGTLGRVVSAELSKRHEVIGASLNKGELKVDITSAESIRSLFKQVGPFDALVSTTGSAYFGNFHTMTEENVYVGIRSKLMGQVNLVLIGQHYINRGGSFTLVSGILAEDPIPHAAAISLVNGAVNSFVIGASVDLPIGIRINAISPGLVEDSADMLSAFPGHNLVPMDRVVNGFLKSVEGRLNGQIIRIY